MARVLVSTPGLPLNFPGSTGRSLSPGWSSLESSAGGGLSSGLSSGRRILEFRQQTLHMLTSMVSLPVLVLVRSKYVYVRKYRVQYFTSTEYRPLTLTIQPSR